RPESSKTNNTIDFFIPFEYFPENRKCLLNWASKLANTFEFELSQTFQGVIWNTLASGNSHRLFLEVRNPDKRTVSFSALNLRNNQWLWKDIIFDEPWWVSLRAAEGDMLLLTVYTDAANPDKKSLVAYDVVKE